MLQPRWPDPRNHLHRLINCYFHHMSKLIDVMVDVHSQISLAAEGLEHIESERERPVDQVFSVSDLWLFLHEGDWKFLTRPKKYRHCEDCSKIRDAYTQWSWRPSVRKPDILLIRDSLPVIHIKQVYSEICQRTFLRFCISFAAMLPLPICDLVSLTQ